MKIALLGAGRIGQTIAQWLHQSGSYDVTVADHDPAALLRMEENGFAVQRLSVDDSNALQRLAAQQDAIINALPFSVAVQVAQACAAVGTHYFDLTEDVAATQQIEQLAATTQATAFMPQCGLAPGFVGVAAHSIARQFDHVDQIKMRVGALPRYPNNHLKYNITWSPDGLVNEYCQPCQAIRNGTLQTVQPLQDLEQLTINGTAFEAFNTSGGLGTLCEVLKGKVTNLDYKSIRYPGHAQYMRFLLDDLQFRDRQQALIQLLQDTIPAARQDIVIVFIAVSGWIQGRYEQDVFTRTIMGRQTGEYAGRAIQIATAAGVCTVVDLFREGKLPSEGFIGQDAVSLDDFLLNKFSQAYRAS